jgi:flagellin
VKDSLQRGQSTIDVALAAGDTITDLLGKMKEKALAASDTSLNTASFNALNADFVSLRDQITKAATNSKFNGVSLADGKTATMTFLANSDGTGVTVTAQNLSLAGLGISTAAVGFATASAAKTMIATIDKAIGVGNLVDADLAKESAKLQSLQTKQQLGIQALSIANSASSSILSLFR